MDKKKNCFDDVAVENLLYCANDETDAGLSENNIYYITEKDVKTLEIPLKSGNYKEAGTISKEIVAETGKGFVRLDCLIDENELTTALAGKTGNKKQSTSLDIFIPGIRAEVLGFIRKFKSDRLIFIVTTRDGRKFVIGNKINSAYMEDAKGSSGKGQDDNNGVSVTLTARAPLLEYTGSIPLKVEKND